MQNRILQKDIVGSENERQSIEAIHWVANNLNNVHKLYLEYCLKAGVPEKRDYDLLKKFLYKNILQHAEVCELALTGSVSKLMFDPMSIKIIYDVGAGHDGWARIFKKVFPNAKIVLIDKNIIVCHNNHEGDGFTVVNLNIFDCLDNLNSGPDVLYFMSEFLHCKRDNMRLLNSEKVKQSQVCINELNLGSYNEPIHNRLEKTGGGLIDCEALRIREKEWFKNRQGWLVNYQSSFDYFLWLLTLKS